MSSSSAVLWQIALILQHANVVPPITEEMIEQACAELRKASWGWVTSGVFIVLQVFLPDKCLEFDTEIDNMEEAAEVVHMYVRATGGEWVAVPVLSSVLPDRADGCWEAIDFVCQGTSYHWEFNIATADGTGTDWPGLFYRQLDEVLKKHLKGVFFCPWLGGQGQYGCYLPRQVADELVTLQENMEAHFGWDGFAAFVQAL